MALRLISKYTYRYEPVETIQIGFTTLFAIAFAWLYPPLTAFALPLGYGGSWLTMNFVPLEYFLMYLERKRKFFSFIKEYASEDLRLVWVYFTVFFIGITVFLILMLDKDSAFSLSKGQHVGLVVGAGVAVYLADLMAQKFVYRSAKRNETYIHRI